MLWGLLRQCGAGIRDEEEQGKEFEHRRTKKPKLRWDDFSFKACD
jgi:hypothetical protein